MPLDVITVPCLSDNYAFVVGDPETGNAAVVDAPEAAPINAVLAAKGWTLTAVLLTHHHDDHIAGVADLTRVAEAAVIGARADAHRLPPLSDAVAAGDTLSILGQDVHVFDVSGHTVGHIAFYLPGIAHVFTGDSLMALGCGRLFEGTPTQMWDSLQKLRALPDDTVVCSGHEYTQSNAKFALTVDPHNEKLRYRSGMIDTDRSMGRPTVPSPLLLEKETNPFLRPDDPMIRAHLDMTAASDAAVFANIRKRKDNF